MDKYTLSLDCGKYICIRLLEYANEIFGQSDKMLNHRFLVQKLTNGIQVNFIIDRDYGILHDVFEYTNYIYVQSNINYEVEARETWFPVVLSSTTNDRDT